MMMASQTLTKSRINLLVSLPFRTETIAFRALSNPAKDVTSCRKTGEGKEESGIGSCPNITWKINKNLSASTERNHFLHSCLFFTKTSNNLKLLNLLIPIEGDIHV